MRQLRVRGHQAVTCVEPCFACGGVHRYFQGFGGNDSTLPARPNPGPAAMPSSARGPTATAKATSTTTLAPGLPASELTGCQHAKKAYKPEAPAPNGASSLGTTTASAPKASTDGTSLECPSSLCPTPASNSHICIDEDTLAFTLTDQDLQEAYPTPRTPASSSHLPCPGPELELLGGTGVHYPEPGQDSEPHTPAETSPLPVRAQNLSF